MPGTGQVHQGHYLRGALFATTAIVSGVGVFISQIHYNRAVERYHDNKDQYLEFGRRYESGEMVNYGEVERTRSEMIRSYEQAKRRYRWRNAFLGTLVGCYLLNLADVVVSKPVNPDELSWEVRRTPDGVGLVRVLRF
jgi:hypothetical protein